MLGLDGYGSDAESDTSDTPVVAKPTTTTKTKVAAPPKSSLASLLPPAKGSSLNLPPPSTKSNTPPSAVGGLNLPPPKWKGKRREPVKITVEALKPVEDDDEEHASKRRKIDGGAEKKTGAGASALLAMLPAPKVTKIEEVKKEEPKALGARAGGSDAGVVVAEPPVLSTSKEEDGGDLSFLPAFLRKPRTKPAPAFGKTGAVSAPQPAATSSSSTSAPPAEEDESEDFFSLGSKASSSGISSRTSKLGLGPKSVAPQVKEFVPPDPTPFDPYPGYYEKPNGDWAAYDPDYYKSFWNTWQAAYKAGQSGREGKGWEGADSADMESVDAVEAAKTQQTIERECMKVLTAPQIATPPPPKIQKQANSVARSRHQLSTLLQEAFQNRSAIEEKLAEGRRNRKEAGNKYGF